MEWTQEEELYRRLGPRMMALASVTVGPSSAPDVVSSVVLDLLRKKRWTRVDDPAAYAMRAVVLASRMHLRSEGRRAHREHRLATSSSISAHSYVGGLEVDSNIIVVLRDLSAQQRAVVYLTYWEDLAPQTIASLLDISDGSVRRQLARARAQLRKRLA
jgi:RNA polymerase sigma factor (sigma-70 family)